MSGPAKLRLVLFAGLLGCWLAGSFGVEALFAQTPGPASPKTIVIHGQCRAKAGNDACWGFAKRPKIAVYSEPAVSTRILDRYLDGTLISLLEPAESKGHPGWISVAAVDRGRDAIGWIRHEDAVLATDLRRVTGCWPVEALNWDEEASESSEGGKYRLRFNTEGGLLPGKRGTGNGANNDYFAKHFGVFYAGGMTMIRHLSEPNGERPTLAPIFLLDYSKRQIVVWFNVSPPGTKIWRLFPDEKLKGCGEIPGVDSKSPVKFK